MVQKRFDADDEELAAKVIVAAGGYEKFFLSHIACPGAEVFERVKPLTIPNYSVRMSALTAAAIRPQIKELPARIEHANQCYALVCDRLVAGAREVRTSLSLVLCMWCMQRFVVRLQRRCARTTRHTLRRSLCMLCAHVAGCRAQLLVLVVQLAEACVQKGAAIEIPDLHPKMSPHKDSIQFNLVGYTFDQVRHAILQSQFCSPLPTSA